jgi:hypothetical protein
MGVVIRIERDSGSDKPVAIAFDNGEVTRPLPPSPPPLPVPPPSPSRLLPPPPQSAAAHTSTSRAHARIQCSCAHALARCEPLLVPAAHGADPNAERLSRQTRRVHCVCALKCAARRRTGVALPMRRERVATDLCPDVQIHNYRSACRCPGCPGTTGYAAHTLPLPPEACAPRRVRARVQPRG